MRNYFLNMNFEDVVQDLMYTPREDEALALKGKQLILIACMIVSPSQLVSSQSLTTFSRPTPPRPKRPPPSS